MSHADSIPIPPDIGRQIVESAAMIACPLLGTDRFVTYCRDRGVSINRERLIRLERLGLFTPIFRVRTPEESMRAFSIPVQENNNWFSKGYAIDTTAVPSSHDVPLNNDTTREGYYSIFQIDWLQIVIQAMTMHIQCDSYLDGEKGREFDWDKLGTNLLNCAKGAFDGLIGSCHLKAVALLCQFISNRYYPQAKTDQRTISIGGASYSDRWIVIHGHGWDWHDCVRTWEPKKVEQLFKLTPGTLKQAYEGLAFAQESCDPLARWYQLVQFVSVDERQRLKGDPLRAETIRAAAHMLRLLYEDLYQEELPHPNEITKTIITHVPELAVRQDKRRYLEFVANRFGLNPQPKLALVVEGPTEDRAVNKLFLECFGLHPGSLGIEIIVLGGVDAATGGKEDRFRAVLRLIDYLHHHQTLTFVILDNDNFARNLKDSAETIRSIHGIPRFVTRPDYIHLWKRDFEFDNWSCSEIATAMSEMAGKQTIFTPEEIAACEKGSQKTLKTLYKERAGVNLRKDLLGEKLAEMVTSTTSARKPKSRPIIKVLRRVAHLAARNPLPSMLDVWQKNQVSEYFGKLSKKKEGDAKNPP